MGWRPATVQEVLRIIDKDLSGCDDKQIATFRRYEIVPYVAPITRYRAIESVVVVAKKGNDVIYWEDVEEGFNISPLAPDGSILEHFCDQNDLAQALHAWIEE